MTYTFDGRAFARAWLAVAVASGADKDVAQLYRTVSIEAYPDGFRLVATDSTVLLSAWVPTVVAGELATEPALDEVPQTTAIAIDTHGRGKGFLGHVLKLTSGEDADKLEVTVRLGVTEPEDADATPTFAGLEATYVELSLPESEQVRLLTYEGDYPAWRGMVTGWAGAEAETIALAPDMAGRLAKLGKIQPGTRLGFSWSGSKLPAWFVLVDSDPHVSGLVMPTRWDFETNAPFVVPDDLSGLEP